MTNAETQLTRTHTHKALQSTCSTENYWHQPLLCYNTMMILLLSHGDTRYIYTAMNLYLNSKFFLTTIYLCEDSPVIVDVNNQSLAT